MPLPRCLATAALTTALALALPYAVDAQRQDGIQSGYVALGTQGYALDDLNAALGLGGFPRVDRTAFRTSIGASRRLPGRLCSESSLWWDRFEADDEITAAGAGVQTVSSTRLGAIGIATALDVDLLYPSAWNLYLGVGVDLGGGRLVTTRLFDASADPADGAFAADVRENKFTVASVGFAPRLTLESTEFGTKSGVGMRLFVQGGYRFGLAAEIEREGFLDQEIAPEFGNSGLTLQFGLSTRLLEKE